LTGGKRRGHGIWIPAFAENHTSQWLTKEFADILYFPLWKRGRKGDFKNKCYHL
jgi:hypothetical protein